MLAYLFPGQGSQYVGMAQDLFEEDEQVKSLFKKAEQILGFNITQVMFNGPEEELKATKITQPAVFLHSMALIEMMGNTFKPDFVAGHSLGEISALVANKTLTFEDGLKVVKVRANAMQAACDCAPSTMAAIIGLDDKVVEDICNEIEHVVPANYNCPGQVVISGITEDVQTACNQLKERGAKLTIPLKVAGAFHSACMEPARVKIEKEINTVSFAQPICPIYQNVDAIANRNPDKIRQNLIKQLTSPVRWTQTIQNMINDGADSFSEIGPGKVLQGLVKKVNREVEIVGR